MRVLEIGAGTGGTTAHILDALPAGSSYCFTDISPAFFPAARARFAASPFITWQTLDIERDPREQGLLPHAFDLLVAANVLHATRDIDRTLAHVARLVAPDGLCLLLEGVERRAWLDLTFGLLPGWWRFADARRTDYPLLDREAWSAALAAHGLTGMAVASIPGEAAEQAVMVARRSATDPSAAADNPDGWLIFADASGVAEALSCHLAGADCVTVAPGPAFARTAPDRYVLPAGDRDACTRMLAEIAARGIVLRRAVYLWGLDAAGADSDSATLPDRVLTACAGLLAVVQALAGSVAPSFLGLSIVTRGAQPIGSGPAIAQAAVLGLGLGIATEHPELRCRRIDLDPAAPAGEAGVLWAELNATDGEDQIAWRGQVRRVARLTRMAPPQLPAAAFACRPDRCYLIAGGLGGLGLEVARWMVERGARHLVLLGRSPPSAAATAALQSLRDQDCDVLVVQADVADAGQVRRVLDDIRCSPAPLHGVVHAAGQLHDAALLHQTPGSFAEVLAAKVAGAWNLHCLTEGDDLDCFALFSSTAGVLGSWGQANHAAANAFLDALAHHRRACGQPAVSIDWGPWSQVGAAARRGVESRMAEHGVGVLSPEHGIAALERCLIESPVQAAVVRIDWARLAEDLRHRQRPPLLAEQLGRVRDNGPNQPADRGELLRRLQALEPAAATPALVERIQREVVQVLRLGPQEHPDPHRGWFDLGMDSLVLMELYHWLQAELGDACRLPSTIAFELPTISALARHIVGELHKGEGGAASGTDMPPPAAPDDGAESARAVPGRTGRPTRRPDGSGHGTDPRCRVTVESREIRERLESAVLVIRRQQARIAELEAAQTQPVAIVGLGCRFPGGADSPDAFWRLLRDGVDAVGEVPAERWDVDAFYDSDRSAPGRMYTRHGAFLDRLDQFDPVFFGISPREAEYMDPQQRLLLEVAWETLEDAGAAAGRPARQPDRRVRRLDVERLRGRDHGRRRGRATSGRTRDRRAPDRSWPDRLSYQFGWQGPSIPVDTACASSLVAVHLACASLRNGECAWPWPAA